MKVNPPATFGFWRGAVWVIDIGLNPGEPPVLDSKMTAWMTTGMVTIGTGNNVWAGGENNSTHFLACFLPGCTLTVDGKVVVENGSLKH